MKALLDVVSGFSDFRNNVVADRLVFKNHEVGVENSSLLFPKILGYVASNFGDLIFGLRESVFESGNFRVLVLFLHLVFRHLDTTMKKTEDLPMRNPGRGGYPIKYFFFGCRIHRKRGSEGCEKLSIMSFFSFL